MKKPSGTSAPPDDEQRDEPDHVFFTDRDLGKTFPARLRSAGLTVEPFYEHFTRQFVPDEEWISFVGERNLVAITHDRHIRSRSRETDALMEARARVFVIRGTPPHHELAEAFVEAIPKVKRFLEGNPAPFIAVVYKRDSGVRMWLTEEKWKVERAKREELKRRRPAGR